MCCCSANTDQWNSVLNGIAYDSTASSAEKGYRLFLTGKLWDVLYEVWWRPTQPLLPRPVAW